MGIDPHALNFLRYAHQFGPFGRTVTIGRQNIHFKARQFRQFTGTYVPAIEAHYCEPLLTDYFGASAVDSIDNSDFEQATLIHDMNLPLPEAWVEQKFDTIIDCGTLEHIFNVPQAFSNLSALANPGAQILHVLPSNNFCGHGFYQFNPELFFSLYCDVNGYRDTSVFLADATRLQTWFRVCPPPPGERVNVHTDTPVYVLARTVLKDTTFGQYRVQQSDYVHRWALPKDRSEPRKKKRGKRSEFAERARTAILSVPALAKMVSRFRSRPKRKATERLDAGHPYLKAFPIASLRDPASG